MEDKKIKVLHLVPKFATGGAEILLLDTIPEFPKDKFEISICAFFESGELSKKFIEKGVEVFAFESTHDFYSQIKNLYKLVKLIKKQKIDILHIHLMCKQILVLRLFLPKMKIIFNLHSNIQYNSVALRLYNSLISCGNEMHQRLLKSRFKKKSFLIKNAISEKRIISERDSNDLKDELGINKNNLVIFSAGRLIDTKNFTFPIDSLKSLIEKNKSIKFFIAGDGPESEKLKKCIQEMNLTDNIILLGRINNVKDYYRISDIYINTSHFEGLSLTILEAMANRLPVIASNVPGNREFLDSEGVLLYEPGSSGNFCQKIEFLINDIEKREMVRASAYDTYIDKYSVDRYVRELSQFYFSTVN